MSVQRRKDNKGRVLKNGESQRKNGSYMYRYSDANGTRHTVYAPDLKTLREKEEKIQKDIINNIDLSKDKITVSAYFKSYLDQKKNIKSTTRSNYEVIFLYLKKYGLGEMPIKNVKITNAKNFVIDIFKNGASFSTVQNVKGHMKSLFDLACEEDIIYKNPFTFTLSKVIPYEKHKKEALTSTQIDALLDYVHSNTCYKKHEDEIKILLYTGLRIGELYGLTFDDVDFEHKWISVNHQLVFYRKYDGGFIQEVHKPKTESGVRYVPMSDEVVQCFKNVIAARVHLDKEPVIDGYTNFIFITKNGVKSKYNLGPALTRIMKTYNEKFQDKEPLPNLTPHIFRHTFCTELINKGMNLKSVQYVMGHASIETTLNIYTHVNKMDVFEEFEKISGKPATNNCVYLSHAV